MYAYKVQKKIYGLGATTKLGNLGVSSGSFVYLIHFWLQNIGNSLIFTCGRVSESVMLAVQCIYTRLL